VQNGSAELAGSMIMGVDHRHSSSIRGRFAGQQNVNGLSERSDICFHQDLSNFPEGRIAAIVPIHQATNLVGSAQLTNSFFGNAERAEETIDGHISSQGGIDLLDCGKRAPLNCSGMKSRYFVTVPIFCWRLLTPVVRRAKQFMRLHLMFILLPTPSPIRRNFQERRSTRPSITLRKVSSMSNTA
jgi:hypothetical protein